MVRCSGLNALLFFVLSELPQYLYEAEWCIGAQQVAVVVPRRIAAITLAKRVAEEMDMKLGDDRVGRKVI